MLKIGKVKIIRSSLGLVTLLLPLFIFNLLSLILLKMFESLSVRYKVSGLA
ncbi:hypothetical protein Sjap_015114 [Stephania japonica]|uniref:Uncharacterized protein n=1 Tax=Stephania japonica TaxID=461633 RepID=A0AAP0NQJ1_9MAGN